MKNDWLLDYRKNVTSQNGEDGIIEKIFETIGEDSRWCVELGALTGTKDSNVWSLIKQKGWSGVLIEADPDYFEKLKETYAEAPAAYPLNAFVSFEGEDSLDSIFARTPLPRKFDLLSLDIDGNDYHLWDSLIHYRSRVVIVEFNPSIPNGISFIQPRNMGVYQGSSLEATVALGNAKGYELVAVHVGNAFFVEKELFSRFHIEDNSISVLHTDHAFETQIFQLYDGTLVLAGNTKLIWHRIPIDQERIQILPKRKRTYPWRISPNPRARSFMHFVRNQSVMRYAREQAWFRHVRALRRRFFP